MQHGAKTNSYLPQASFTK